MRLYRAADQIPYTGDTTSELLFAYNDIRDGHVTLLGPAATGVIGQNLPYIEYFHEALLAVTGGNPFAALVLYTALMALVPWLIYRWAAAEGDTLGAVLAAGMAVIFTNSYQILRVSYLIAVAGFTVIQIGHARKRSIWVDVGYGVLTFSAAAHASNIAAVAVQLAVDAVRYRDWRVTLRHIQVVVGVAAVCLVPFVVAAVRFGDRFVLFNSRHPVCLTCIDRIPAYAAAIAGWFSVQSLPDPSALWAVRGLGIAAGVLALLTRPEALRRTAVFCGLYLAVLYLTVDRLEDRYFLPVVPWLFVGAGAVLSAGIRSRGRIVQPAAVAVAVGIFLVWSASYIRDRQGTWSIYSTVVSSVAAVRAEADKRGIAHDQYVLVGAFPWENLLSASSALWLTEQWRYGKRSSPSVDVPSYTPPRQNVRPAWFFLVCMGPGPAADCRSRVGWWYGSYVYAFTFPPVVPGVAVYAYGLPGR